MCVKIRHRGLRRLHERGDRSALNHAHVPRIRRVLTLLNQATETRHLDVPGLGLHALKGDRRGEWSVEVSGNWRIVFRFEAEQAVDVDLVDYH